MIAEEGYCQAGYRSFYVDQGQRVLLPVNKGRLERIPKDVSPTGGIQMGFVYAEIELTSIDDLVLHRRGFLTEDKIKRMRVEALVDTGAFMLVINEHIKQQLDLPLIEEQLFRMADDSERKGQVVGPVEIRFENRRTSVNAVVLPGLSEVLLGSIPLEDLDVAIDPKKRQLMVNPESPYIATKPLKRYKAEKYFAAFEGQNVKLAPTPVLEASKCQQR